MTLCHLMSYGWLIIFILIASSQFILSFIFPVVIRRLRWEECMTKDVRKAGEEEDWKKKTRYRGGWTRLSDEAVKKLRAAPHPWQGEKRKSEREIPSIFPVQCMSILRIFLLSMSLLVTCPYQFNRDIFRSLRYSRCQSDVLVHGRIAAYHSTLPPWHPISFTSIRMYGRFIVANLLCRFQLIMIVGPTNSPSVHGEALERLVWGELNKKLLSVERCLRRWPLEKSTEYFSMRPLSRGSVPWKSTSRDGHINRVTSGTHDVVATRFTAHWINITFRLDLSYVDIIDHLAQSTIYLHLRESRNICNNRICKSHYICIKLCSLVFGFYRISVVYNVSASIVVIKCSIGWPVL